jgi:hypothetical protein
MVVTPEREPQAPAPPSPEGVIERPETFVVPEQIQKIATSTPTQVTTQVTDDSGQPLTQPTVSDPAMQIPIDPVASENWRKWSLTDAITWLTVFWLRAAKKARHLGKKVVFIGRKNK